MRHKVCIISIILAVLFLFSAKALFAEIEKVEIGVDGLSCPFCVQGLAKKLNKVKSFEQVDISYKLGLAKAKLKEKSFLDLAEVKQAIKESGFTLRDITITAIGTIISWEDRLALKVQGSGQTFLLYESAQILEKSHIGETVLSENLKNQLEHYKSGEDLVSLTGEVHEHQGMPPSLGVDKISRAKK